MSPADEAHPPRRDSWSLRSIVQDVAGKSLEEFQDPGREPHPYLRVKPPPTPPFVARPPPGTTEAPPAAVPAPAHEPRGTDDPVARVYPPLTGAVGRALHGSAHEHDAETLAHKGAEGAGNPPGRPNSPSRRPERVYLHYLMLHLDRLSDHALRYLKHAVDEELSHREAENPPTPAPVAPTPTPAPAE